MRTGLDARRLHTIIDTQNEIAATALELDAVMALVVHRAKQLTEVEQADDQPAAVAAAARELALRGEDTAYRIGGDEFALLLVEATTAGAELVATRTAGAIAGDSECRGVGASWGLAELAPDDDAASLLARADAALYAVKAARV
jgi:diguanylate cyclase (GGDEF)-like protein